MVSLKKLNESLVLQEIKQNYFLNALYEASMGGAAGQDPGEYIGQKIEELESAVSRVFPASKFPSMDAALKKAKTRATQYLTIKNSAKKIKILGNIMKFYSNISNFLQKDLANLYRTSQDFKTFFDKLDPQNPIDKIISLERTNKEVLKYLEQKGSNLPEWNPGKIRKFVAARFTEDDSPWYKQAADFFLGSTIFRQGIPFINLDQFLDEFMKSTREEIGTMANVVNSGTLFTPSEQVFQRVQQLGGGAQQGGQQGGQQGAPYRTADQSLDQEVQGMTQSFNKIIAALDSYFPNEKISQSQEKKNYILGMIMSGKNFRDIAAFISSSSQGSGSTGQRGGARVIQMPAISPTSLMGNRK